ncbi:MgtC/SapB family protein [Ensifer canadensis]
MDQIAADMFPPSHIPYQVIFARMVGALMMGALIGFEREAKARPAGLKTHMLVSLSACTFAIISLESVYMKGFFDQRVQIDPLRVVEAVTAGVAFLAAGTIILSRGRVQGLTTGSSLWLAGAIGLALGFGHWIIAAFAAGSAFLVLFVVGKLEAEIKEEGQLGPDPQITKPRDEKAAPIRKAAR